MWAAIKKAINSSIGTSDFQPLDKMILGQKSLVASDNVYQVIKATRFSLTPADSAALNLFQLNCTASFKLKFRARYYNYESSLGIYKNGTLYTSVSLAYSSGFQTYISDAIIASKNDIISIKPYNSSGNGSVVIEEIDLCADIIDGSLLTLL